MEPRGLRSPNFAKRLRQACDKFADCPPLHQGRQTWLKQALINKGLIVSVESIRKWLEGEGRPKQEKCEALALILGVDPTWLYMGMESPHEHNSVASQGVATPTLPIAIRADLVVEVSGVPMNLTQNEARKIANVILALATPQD